MYNVCISFLPFFLVSTCIVWLLLPTSIIQLFKKIINSINGLLLILILLSQLNYFCSKTLKTSLHNMTIWKIVSTSIYKCLKKGIKFEVLHVWPKNILSHHIMISPVHHFTIEPFHHLTITPYYHHTIESIPLFSKLVLIPCTFFHIIPRH